MLEDYAMIETSAEEANALITFVKDIGVKDTPEEVWDYVMKIEAEMETSWQ